MYYLCIKCVSNVVLIVY